MSQPFTSTDIVTMRTMRQNGKSNREIASSMGCCESSVRRLIGKLTSEERRAIAVRCNTTVPASLARHPRPQTSASSSASMGIAIPSPICESSQHLLITSILAQIKGKHFNYFIDTEGKTITFSRNGCCDLILTPEELLEFQQELKELNTMVETWEKEKA